ncbi:MAG: hypothetical protein ACYDHH_18965, partial [Solirubrobacteraceae bacterium]
MAKRDNKDIFQRLRQVGLRKQAARALSELGDTTSKRAVRAARAVVTELRSLADELEQRLPDATSDPAPVGTPASSTKRSTGTSAPPATTARRRRAPRAASPATPASAPSRAADAAAKPTTTAKTPRGENKAKIL